MDVQLIRAGLQQCPWVPVRFMDQAALEYARRREAQPQNQQVLLFMVAGKAWRWAIAGLLSMWSFMIAFPLLAPLFDVGWSCGADGVAAFNMHYFSMILVVVVGLALYCELRLSRITVIPLSSGLEQGLPILCLTVSFGCWLPIMLVLTLMNHSDIAFVALFVAKGWKTLSICEMDPAIHPKFPTLVYFVMLSQLARAVLRNLPRRPSELRLEFVDDFQENVYDHACCTCNCSNEIGLNYWTFTARMSTTYMFQNLYIRRRVEESIMGGNGGKAIRRLSLWLERESINFVFLGPFEHAMLMVAEAWVIVQVARRGHSLNSQLMLSLIFTFAVAVQRICQCGYIIPRAVRLLCQTVPLLPDNPAAEENRLKAKTYRFFCLLCFAFVTYVVQVALVMRWVALNLQRRQA